MNELFNRRGLSLTATLLILTACASPTVDKSSRIFDEMNFMVDLDNCRGGSVLDVALKGFVGAVSGSAIGLAQGASTAVFISGSLEIVMIGAVVGGVVGVVMGAYEPIQEHEQRVSGCLREQGYVLTS